MDGTYTSYNIYLSNNNYQIILMELLGAFELGAPPLLRSLIIIILINL